MLALFCNIWRCATSNSRFKLNNLNAVFSSVYVLTKKNRPFILFDKMNQLKKSSFKNGLLCGWKQEHPFYHMYTNNFTKPCYTILNPLLFSIPLQIAWLPYKYKLPFEPCCTDSFIHCSNKGMRPPSLTNKKQYVCVMCAKVLING